MYLTPNSIQRSQIEDILNTIPTKPRGGRWLHNPKTVNFVPTHWLMESGPAGVAFSAIVNHNSHFPSTSESSDPTIRAQSYIEFFERQLKAASFELKLVHDREYGTVGFMKR